MVAPAEYLEEAAITDLSRQLADEGYKVVREARSKQQPYDLVATKNGRKIAFEVALRSNLGESAPSIATLRREARQQGYDEFRLVIVDPPHETPVEIEGLETALFRHLVEDTPEELDELSSSTRVEDVNYVEIDSITISKDDIRVIGNAVVAVELEYGGGNERDGASYSMDFPFHFDIRLGRDLQIEEVLHLKVDTSSFDE